MVGERLSHGGPGNKLCANHVELNATTTPANDLDQCLGMIWELDQCLGVIWELDQCLGVIWELDQCLDVICELDQCLDVIWELDQCLGNWTSARGNPGIVYQY